jgi:hypothetical protein
VLFVALLIKMNMAMAVLWKEGHLDTARHSFGVATTRDTWPFFKPFPTSFTADSMTDRQHGEFNCTIVDRQKMRLHSSRQKSATLFPPKICVKLNAPFPPKICVEFKVPAVHHHHRPPTAKQSNNRQVVVVLLPISIFH